jgi:hypothetical protein
VQVLTKDERDVLRDALRGMAGRDARSADYASGNPTRDTWVKSLREECSTNVARARRRKVLVTA